LTVAGLTLGDYLLWKWSLGSHQDILALVAGLTLPPLGAALVWLTGLLAVRVLARQTRRAARRAPRLVAREGRRRRAPAGVRLAGEAPRRSSTAGDGAAPGRGHRRSRSGRRIAA
jgi:hypothetical protein